jgi:acyl carrier protein
VTADRLLRTFAAGLGLSEESLGDETSPDNTPEWDSMAAITLVTEIEETFGVELTTSEIMRIRSIGVAREVLRAKGVPDV